MITKICPQCNELFTTEYKAQKFCSKKCLGRSLSRKIQITCPECKKTVYVYKGTKFCSKNCADSARRGVRLHPPVIKICRVCNKSFESKYDSQKFCSRSCSSVGKNAPKIRPLTPEEREERSIRLKYQWQDENFRNIVVTRMKTHNPVYTPGVVEKANVTRTRNKLCHNNFKYGNGKISPYEEIVKCKLEPLGFLYNYAIVTRLAREKNPEAKYPNCYKPDFTHLGNRLCIEIDGAGHSSSKEKLTDAKKEECLHILGYTVIRFTHEEIDKGVFDQWLNLYQKEM